MEGVAATMMVSAATLPTMMSLAAGPQAKVSTARVARKDATGAARSVWGVLSWIAESIGYIYRYLREKVDAGERRRRLVGERDGSQQLLVGATKELGAAILREGISAPDFTGLLEAIGRAEARREAALADIAAAERLQSQEDARLGAQETALEAEWRACDGARAEADETLRPVTSESREIANRIARVREKLAALERDADDASTTLDGAGRTAQLRHEASALSTELTALQAQAGRLESELLVLRERSASQRAAAADARSKLDGAISARRNAAGAMGAAIAGHSRERSEAERQAGELTEQLGKAATQVRPELGSLRPLFQRIDRLKEAIAERSTAIAAVDQSLALYDQKRLLAGMGIVAGLVIAVAAVVWVVLR